VLSTICYCLQSYAKLTMNDTCSSYATAVIYVYTKGRTKHCQCELFLTHAHKSDSHAHKTAATHINSEMGANNEVGHNNNRVLCDACGTSVSDLHYKWVAACYVIIPNLCRTFKWLCVVSLVLN